MPKLYEFLGIVVFFYSNEHEPVHVHARWQDFESKIEFKIVNGVIVKLSISSVPGRRPLPPKQSKLFKSLATQLSDEIVASWVNFFVYNKKIVCKKIEKIG